MRHKMRIIIAVVRGDNDTRTLSDGESECIGADALQTSHQRRWQWRRIEHHHLQLLLRALAGRTEDESDREVRQYRKTIRWV
jgi:hypothetical protein